MMNNYINMFFKQAKLNIEWFLLPLGYIPTTEEEELQKTLENKCPVIRLNRELMKWIF